MMDYDIHTFNIFLSACRTSPISISLSFFFFNDPATTEIYTLSLHDALPISLQAARLVGDLAQRIGHGDGMQGDRKSTRLNSSHLVSSYAVFCLKKKKKI